MKIENEDKGGAAAAAATPAEKTEKEIKTLPVSIGLQAQYACPHCGEVSPETDEVELTEENKFRAELPATTGKCDFCEKPVKRDRVVIKCFREGQPPSAE